MIGSQAFETPQYAYVFYVANIKNSTQKKIAMMRPPFLGSGRGSRFECVDGNVDF